MKINETKCLQDKCHQICKMACPEQAISKNSEGQLQIRLDKCNKCKTCKIVCTYKAIED